jgi:hypothetical protein
MTVSKKQRRVIGSSKCTLVGSQWGSHLPRYLRFSRSLESYKTGIQAKAGFRDLDLWNPGDRPAGCQSESLEK